MSNKHTPGPWETSKHGTPEYAPQYGVYGKGPEDIATVKGPNARVDASLISAAPELLEACKNLLSLFDSGWAVRDTSDDASPGFALRQIEPMRKLSFAKGAIAKAETI